MVKQDRKETKFTTYCTKEIKQIKENTSELIVLKKGCSKMLHRTTVEHKYLNSEEEGGGHK